MENKHSTSGMAEDLIRSFVQIACLEIHTKTLIEKRISELENGMVKDEDIQKQVETISELRSELNEQSQLRRKQMLYLYEQFKGGDKEQWCLVKHSAIAMFTAFEAYQAQEDEELFDFAMQANNLFIKYCSKFLGADIEPCASCFSDFLKGVDDET